MLSRHYALWRTDDGSYTTESGSSSKTGAKPGSPTKVPAAVAGGSTHMKLPRLQYSSSYYTAADKVPSAASQFYASGSSLARFYSFFETPHSLARRMWLRARMATTPSARMKGYSSSCLLHHHQFSKIYSKEGKQQALKSKSKNKRWVLQSGTGRMAAKPVLRVKLKYQHQQYPPLHRKGQHHHKASALTSTSFSSVLVEGISTASGGCSSIFSRYRKSRSKGGHKQLVRKQTTLVVPAQKPASKEAGPGGEVKKEDDKGTSTPSSAGGEGASVLLPLSPSLAPLVRSARGRKLVRARQAVQQALVHSRNKSLKRRRKKLEYCLFFNRFGRCNKGEEKCPYLHDVDKVAVCRKFLKGMCTGKGDLDGGKASSCLLSHTIAQDKMPACAFFLKGTCTNDACPYSHVKVNANAEVCPDFLKGYCPKGKACLLKHVLKEKKKAKQDRKRQRRAEEEEQQAQEEEEWRHGKLDVEVAELLSECLFSFSLSLLSSMSIFSLIGRP